MVREKEEGHAFQANIIVDTQVLLQLSAHINARIEQREETRRTTKSIYIYSGQDLQNC